MEEVEPSYTLLVESKTLCSRMFMATQFIVVLL